MTPILVAAAILFVIVIAVLIARRNRHDEPGVVSFRKHIDALSPEARREVMDRVRPQPRDDRPHLGIASKEEAAVVRLEGEQPAVGVAVGELVGPSAGDRPQRRRTDPGEALPWLN